MRKRKLVKVESEVKEKQNESLVKRTRSTADSTQIINK